MIRIRAGSATGNKAHPTAESSFRFPPASITAIGLSCAAGDQPFALLGAVAAPVSGARPATLSIPSPDGKGEAELLVAPVAGLEEIDNPAQRIALLLQSALGDLVEDMPKGLDASRLLVLILLPDPFCARGNALDTSWLEAQLLESCPSLISGAFRFARSSEGSCRHLEEACREMAEGRWQAVLFGGADSLVDVVTCTELARQERAMTTASGEGLLPGEGAAFVLLESPGSSLQPLANLRAIGAAAEPHVGEADRHQMTGLGSALEQALERGERTLEDLAVFIHPRGGESVDALEWHQLQRRFFPSTSTENHDICQASPAELRPGLALGELGAAALPVMLVLGCARFAFAHPVADTLVAFEVGDAPVRGAVILSRA